MDVPFDDLGFLVAVEPLLRDPDSLLICQECEIGILHEHHSGQLVCDMCDTEYEIGYLTA